MTAQNELGDPQKEPACGDPGDATLTGEVTAYTAGDTVTVTIEEMIFHPGHYRVALALNDVSELPPAPEVTPTAQDQCASTVIQDPPVFPILADGMLAHEGQFEGPQSFEVKLPDDVSCENCTLQIIEYMSSHGAPCFYYHCATISIAPASSGDTSGGPVDTSGGPETSTTDAPGTSTTTTTTDGSGDDDASATASETSTPTTTAATATASGGVATAAEPGGDDDDGGGCHVGASGGMPETWLLLAGWGLFTLQRRRRAPTSSRSLPPSRR